MEETILNNLTRSDVFVALLVALVASQVVMMITLYLFRGQVSKMKLLSWSRKDGLSLFPIEFLDKKKPPPTQKGAD